MTYGISSYSETPYSSLPKRSITLQATSDSAAIFQAVTSVIKCTEMFVVKRNGDKHTVYLDKNNPLNPNTGNILKAFRVGGDNKQVNFTVGEKGSVKEWSIKDSRGIIYYELVKRTVEY